MKPSYLATPATAASMSASLKTTAAFLPPSSRETFFMEAAVSCAILWPTSVEPVKETMRTCNMVSVRVVVMGLGTC